MTDNVVAFVGENENGILSELSLGFHEHLAPLGLRGHLIDLNEPGWADRLDAIAEDGLAFAWGSAGVGARLTVGGQNLWDMLQVPFVSVLADTPCQMPVNHRVASRYVANGYIIPDWLDVQRRFIRSPQISASLPFAVLPNPERDLIPWAERPHRMVFVKTGDDPARRRAGWDAWPAALRAVLHDAAAEAGRRPTGEISDIVLDAALGQGLFLEERLELLFSLAYQVDLHTRALRATAFAQALLPLDATIVGRGWDHLDTGGARATLHSSVPAAELPALYARTQFLVSTNPNFGRGVHERPLNAFAARACMVSDDNAFTAQRFAGLPTWFGLDWTAPDLADRIAAIFEDPRDYGPHTDQSLALVEAEFGPDAFLRGMIDLAAVVRAANRLERFPQ